MLAAAGALLHVTAVSMARRSEFVAHRAAPPSAPRALCAIRLTSAASRQPRGRRRDPSAMSRSGRHRSFTGAAPARRTRPQTQGSMAAHATPLPTGTDCPSGRLAAAGGVWRSRSNDYLPLSVSRPGQPLPSCLSSRRLCRLQGVRWRPAHRSVRLNDQTYADRCHSRGRDPRGGAGR
jgi:hypothetical protein